MGDKRSSTGNQDLTEQLAETEQLHPEDGDTAKVEQGALPTVFPAVRNASIVFIYPADNMMGKRISLDRSEYFLGRGTDADIQLDRTSVSRRHARLFQENSHWFIEDLGSTNGVVVNGSSVKRSELSDGSTLRIGDVVLRFLASENIEAAYHENLYRLTILDSLTGIVNKRYFSEFLEREAALAARYRHPLCLLMMDIDRFKQINDTFGHQAGDTVLQVVASRVRPRIRREDLFARYGGDEFAIILTHTDTRGGLELAEQIRRLLYSRPVLFENHPLQISVSIGIASSSSLTDIDASTLIQAADRNLYEAKAAGRNKIMG